MSNFNALYSAYKKVILSKRYKIEAMKFNAELNYNLYQLYEELKKGQYKISRYFTFKVYEPKIREIKSLPFRDRIVQRSLCNNVLIPFFSKRLIYDNCACQEGKGTHFGLNRVCGFMCEHYNKHGANGYILKGDITKYFYSINCGILKSMILPHIEDEKIIRLLTHIIDSGSENDVGIPLGNQTSQWFALLYLNPLDRLIKEKLKIKHYSRYMDDFVLICEDKEYLKYCLVEIAKLVESLGLKLNPKTQIFPLKNGVDYLGWHIYLTETGKVIKKLRQSSKKRMKKRLKVHQRQYANGELELKEIRQRLMSWVGHARHGHTYHLQTKIFRLAVFQKDSEKTTKQEVDTFD